MLVTTDATLVERVEAALERQLATLPTAPTARRALENGYAVVVDSLAAGIAVCDRLAPEHLEVLGDYGAGPNHVLPTGGTARSVGGLSVLTFLRVQTWIAMDEPRQLARDAAALARMEGLEAHARSAERRVR